MLLGFLRQPIYMPVSLRLCIVSVKQKNAVSNPGRKGNIGHYPILSDISDTIYHRYGI